MIEVTVFNDNGNWHQWWINFRAYHEAQGVNMDNDKEITRTLAEWRAIDDDPESASFFFENEQDHVMFLLRWS